MTPLRGEQRQALKFVKVSPGDTIDLDLFPSFMAIGPQRTGTSWLHENLVEHPQIFMPEQKELYYFNSLRFPDSHPVSLPPVKPDLAWYLDFFKPTDAFLETREAECQRQYGEPYVIHARGEATATYAAALDEELIEEILVLRPDLRVAVIVRDPVERAWSHAKKDLPPQTGLTLGDIAEDDFKEFFGEWYQMRCGNYSEIIARWQSLLMPGHVWVGSFTQLTSDPGPLLLEFFDFIGVDRDRKYITDTAGKKFNPTDETPIPEDIREVLQDIFAPEIRCLNEMGIAY